MTTIVREPSVQATYSSSVGGERNGNSFGTRGPLRVHTLAPRKIHLAHGVCTDRGCSGVDCDRTHRWLQSHVPPTAITRIADCSRTCHRLHPQISCVRARTALTRSNVPSCPLRSCAPSRPRGFPSTTKFLAWLPIGRELSPPGFAFGREPSRSIRVFDLAHGFRPRGEFVPYSCSQRRLWGRCSRTRYSSRIYEVGASDRV